MLHLGERDQRDEQQRHQSVEPPQALAQRAAGGLCHACRPHGLGEHCTRRRPPSVTPYIGSSLEPHQPCRFQEVAGCDNDQQCPQERPVFAAIAAAVVIRISRLPVRPRIVELWRPQPAAPIHHVGESACQQHPGNIENQREPQIEVPMPEMDTKQWSEDVVVQRDRCRAQEQQQEAVEDQAMSGTSRPVPARYGPVTEHGADHRPETGGEIAAEVSGGSPPVLPDLNVHAEEEQRDCRKADRVEKADRRGRKVLEQHPRDALNLGHRSVRIRSGIQPGSCLPAYATRPTRRLHVCMASGTARSAPRSRVPAGARRRWRLR